VVQLAKPIHNCLVQIFTERFDHLHSDLNVALRLDTLHIIQIDLIVQLLKPIAGRISSIHRLL
jgi:hypothetical protein